MSTDFVEQAASILNKQGFPFAIVSAVAHDKTLRMYNLYENCDLVEGSNRAKVVAELRDLADFLENKGDIDERRRDDRDNPESK